MRANTLYFVYTALQKMNAALCCMLGRVRIRVPPKGPSVPSEQYIIYTVLLTGTKPNHFGYMMSKNKYTCADIMHLFLS